MGPRLRSRGAVAAALAVILALTVLACVVPPASAALHQYRGDYFYVVVSGLDRLWGVPVAGAGATLAGK